MIDPTIFTNTLEKQEDPGDILFNNNIVLFNIRISFSIKEKPTSGNKEGKDHSSSINKTTKYVKK